MSEALSSKQVCALTGVTYRQLDYWVGLGVIEGQGSPGSGMPRIWTSEQVQRVREVQDALQRAIDILEAANLRSAANFLRGGGRVAALRRAEQQKVREQ